MGGTGYGERPYHMPPQSMWQGFKDDAQQDREQQNDLCAEDHQPVTVHQSAHRTKSAAAMARLVSSGFTSARYFWVMARDVWPSSVISTMMGTPAL